MDETKLHEFSASKGECFGKTFNWVDVGIVFSERLSLDNFLFSNLLCYSCSKKIFLSWRHLYAVYKCCDQKEKKKRNNISLQANSDIGSSNEIVNESTPRELLSVM